MFIFYNFDIQFYVLFCIEVILQIGIGKFDGYICYYLFIYRVLELVVKYKIYVDIVLGYRQRYFERFDKKEKNKRFLQYSEGVGVYVFYLEFY